MKTGCEICDNCKIDKKVLVTLKDLERCTCCGCNIDGHVEIDTLRQEAIKWIKEIMNPNYDMLISRSDLKIVKWIKHFFNITEEELK